MKTESNYWEERHEAKMHIAPWAFLLLFIVWAIILVGAVIIGVDEYMFQNLVLIAVVWGIATFFGFLCCSPPNFMRKWRNEGHIVVLDESTSDNNGN